MRKKQTEAYMWCLPLRVQLVRMDYTEVIIDQRFHRHLIGKNGANSEYTSVLKDKRM